MIVLVLSDSRVLMKVIDKNVMSFSTTEPSKVDILTQIHLFLGHTKLKGIININNFDVIISVSSSLVAHTVGKILIIYIKKCLMSGTKKKMSGRSPDRYQNTSASDS